MSAMTATTTLTSPNVAGRAVAASSPMHRRAVSDAVYRRRRTVVGGALAVIAALAVTVGHDVLAGSGGVPASAAVSQPAHVRRHVTALPGDTLWSIAAVHRGDVPIGRYVDTLVDLNGGASIMAGQRVVLP